MTVLPLAHRLTGLRLLADVMRVLLACLTAGGLAAMVVVVFGFGEPLRAWYGLRPESPAWYPVGELWWTNVRVFGWAFMLAIVVTRVPSWRWVCDGLLCLVLGGNLLLAAVAFGAYGGPLLRQSGPHVAVELLAMAVSVAVYRDARREGRIRPWVLTGCAVAVMVLLWIAAVLESMSA